MQSCGSVKYFCFTVLPFGLSLAPYIFNKCPRPLVKFWRFNGVKIVVLLGNECGKDESLQIVQVLWLIPLNHYGSPPSYLCGWV